MGPRLHPKHMLEVTVLPHPKRASFSEAEEVILAPVQICTGEKVDHSPLPIKIVVLHSTAFHEDPSSGGIGRPNAVALTVR